MAGLRTDLAKALTHMERIDTRNLTADQLHSDHETRLRTLEKIDAAGLDKLTTEVEALGRLGLAEVPGRVSALEKFRWTLTGALVAVQVLIGVLEYVLLGHK